MDIQKKITVDLTPDVVREIIADYLNERVNNGSFEATAVTFVIRGNELSAVRAVGS